MRAAALVVPGDLLIILVSFLRPPPTILVIQTPGAALVDPGDLLNSLVPHPSFSRGSFHVLLLLS